MHSIPATAVSIVLASCTLAVPRPSQDASSKRGGCCDLYPAVSGDLVIEVSAGGQSPNMAEIVQRYADLTDQNPVLSSETQSLLSSDRAGVSESITVPAAQVQSFFEQLLIAHDYVMTVLRHETPRLVVIESLRTQARNTIRASAILVPSEHLAHFADHPATIITTVVHLPNTDVRQLSNSMRTLITDANTQQMLPAGNSNTIVLTGLGAQVVGLVEMLRTVDANSVQDDARKLAVFRLQHAEPASVARSLQILLMQRSSTGEGAPAPPPDRFRVIDDERINAVLVSADPATLAEVERLVAELDVAVE